MPPRLSKRARKIARIALVLVTLAPLVSATAKGQGDDSRTYTRACESAVYGELGDGWQESSIIAGRVAFVNARNYRDSPRRWFRKRGDGTYKTHKIMVQIDNGDDVVVRIPKPHRRKAGFVYDPALFNRRLRISQTDYRVTFDVCANSLDNPHGADVTQFNGGFVVAGARCVPVRVLTSQGDLIKKVLISFGAGRCRR